MKQSIPNCTLRLVRKEGRNTYHMGFTIDYRGKSHAETHCNQSGWRGEWREYMLNPSEIYIPETLCQKCFHGARPVPKPLGDPSDPYEILRRAAFLEWTIEAWMVLSDWLEEQGDPACHAVRFICENSPIVFPNERNPIWLFHEHRDSIRDMRLVTREESHKLLKVRCVFWNEDDTHAVVILPKAAP